MKKSIHILNIALVAVFVLAISVPSLLSDKTGGNVSAAENRYLATFPQVFNHARLNWQGGELIHQVEDWINDNTFRREQTRSAIDSFEVQTLRDPRHEELLFSGDWVFLWRYDLPNRLLHLNLLTEEQQSFLLREALAIRQAVENRGAAFCMTLHPHKADVCWNQLPDHLRVEQPRNLMDQYADLFLHREDLVVTSCYDRMVALREADPDSPIHPCYYAAYDASHWNRDGAFLGYESTMEAVRRIFPEVPAFVAEDYEREEITVSHVWCGREYTEPDSKWTLCVERNAIRNDAFFAEVGLQFSDPWHVNRYFFNPSAQEQELPKALVVGDSYDWMFFLDDMAESFSEMLYINVEDAGQLLHVVDVFHPDLVCYAGQGVGSFLQYAGPEALKEVSE